MTKKLVKHGNSYALLIEKPIMRILGIDEKTELKIAIKDGTLVISSAKVRKLSSRDKEINEIAKKIMKKYDPVFKKLANA